MFVLLPNHVVFRWSSVYGRRRCWYLWWQTERVCVAHRLTQETLWWVCLLISLCR